MAEPLPASGYGIAAWKDYDSYWRELDAEFIQDRSILKFATTADRDAMTAPKLGQAVFNEQTDRLEVRAKRGGSGTWVGALMFSNLTSVKDDSAGVNISHSAAGGKGIIFGGTTPFPLNVDVPLNVLTGVLTVDATGVTIKTGTKPVKLTTDAAGLVSDSPVSFPGITLTGSGTISAAGKTATLGGTTVSSLTSPGTISVTGTGTITSPSATLGGVTLESNVVQPPVNYGMQSGQGWFYGNSNSAVMRQRSAVGGTNSPNYVQALVGQIIIGGDSGYFDVNPQMRLFGANSIYWYNAAGTHTAHIAPTIYATSDPGAANYPDGTIWVS